MSADDTVIYDSNPVVLQRKLKDTIKWCKDNMLTINLKKTQCMAVGPQVRTNDVQFTVDLQLERVENYTLV